MTDSEAKTNPVSRQEWILLAGLLLVGLALRLVLWSTQSIVSVDGTTYIRQAWEMAGGPSHDTVQPPGYPFLILLAKGLVPDWVLAARLVSLVSGLALIGLTWALSRVYIRNPWLAAAPALAVALLPLPTRYSLTTMSEAPYLVVLVGMFLFAARQRALLAGLLGGLAYLVRPEALTAVAVLALLSVRVPRRAVLVLAGAALAVAPWVVIQGATTGSWTLTQKTMNIGGAEWWQNEPVVGRERLSPALEGRIDRYGNETLAAYPRRLGDQGKQLLRHGGWVVPLVAGLGLVSGGIGLLPSLAQFFLTPAFSLGSHARFILPYLPFLWILAALGMARIRSPGGRTALGTLCVVGLAFTVAREWKAYRLPEDGYFPELVEVGEWLRPFVDPETVIYDRKPYAPFYARASYRAIPLGTYDQTLDEIVEKGGDYLVVDQAVVDFFRPSLLPLCLDKAVAGLETRLRPAYVNTKYRDRTTLVYRVVRPGGPEPLPVENEPGAIRGSLAALHHQPNHFFHGVLAMRGKRWQAAAGEFAYVLAKDSTNTDALNNRAWSLLQAGRALNVAETAARKAVELEPANPDYLDTLIQVLLARGKPREARQYEAQMERLEASAPPGGG